VRRRRVTLVLIALAVAGVAAAVVSGGDSDEPRSAAPSTRTAREALIGAPAPLAAVHRQANRILGGGAKAFRERLRTLRGYPVVVNKWASWCPPCRAEFPFFQRQSLERGREVAFLGVDANDGDRDAARFLDEFPVSYPSYRDPDLKLSAVFNGVPAFPTTAFYDSRGELAYVKQGGYATERKLVEDIERYAR
jgi:thiol-disulfide isomerase/thioredoxin